ncbi:MAG: rhomboid family intramembrane serine protease [Acidimicrobiia bacterium]
MIPLKDYNPTRHFPYVTVVLIALNIVVFLFVQRPTESDDSEQARFAYRYAAIPCEVVEGRPLSEEEIGRTIDSRIGDDTACDRTSPLTRRDGYFPDKQVWLAVLYSMFLHGGFLHLGGNMLFLWIFGDNVEHRIGHGLYLVFYVVAGIIASFAQILVDTGSVIPTLGASGAISGVLGAYLVMFPTNRVTVFLFRVLLPVPAIVAIGMWAVLQFINGLGAFAVSEETAGGVAYMAHIGGFVAGVVAGIAFRAIFNEPRHPRGTLAASFR